MKFIYSTPNFLSPEECNQIVNYSISNLELFQGAVGVGKEFVVKEQSRKSNIAFSSYNDLFPELVSRLSSSINSNVNLKGFDIYIKDEFQFTEYKEGEFYKWHTDSSDTGPTADRFCSIVIQLTDDYEGGLLQYKLDNDVETFEPGIGNLFVFSSSIKHQVTEVTRGTRYSLVGWFSVNRKSNFKSTLI